MTKLVRRTAAALGLIAARPVLRRAEPVTDPRPRPPMPSVTAEPSAPGR